MTWPVSSFESYHGATIPAPATRIRAARQDRIGALAELISTDEADLPIKPGASSMEEAASVPLVGVAAWQARIEMTNLRAGQKFRANLLPGGTFVISPAKNLDAIRTTVEQVHPFESANAAKDPVDHGRAKGVVVIKVGLRIHGQLETVSLRRSSNCHTSCIAEDRDFFLDRGAVHTDISSTAAS
ncbi:hypothetical protein AXA44_15060 [Rhodococcus sp. SC4]|nr:hypothetical protein AXA44_15060 [Rhodococcus sp. SC4]